MSWAALIHFSGNTARRPFNEIVGADYMEVGVGRIIDIGSCVLMLRVVFLRV